MNQVLLTKAGKDDADKIARILNSATQRKQTYGDESWDGPEWSADEIREDMKKYQFYLAILNQVAVGTVALSWQDEKDWGEQSLGAGYVHRLAIESGHTGSNLGVQILDRLSEVIKKSGKSLMRLSCDQANEKLCHYYLDRGFSPIANSNARHESKDYRPALFEKSI